MNSKKLVTKQTILKSYKSPQRVAPHGATQTFGLNIETVYTRAQFQPAHVEWLKNYNLYAASCEKSLHLFDLHGTRKNSLSFPEQLRVSGFSCLIYISKYHIFAGFSSDFKVYILSDFLEIWKIKQLEPGRVQHAVFLENRDHLIVCWVDNIKIYKLTVKSTYDLLKIMMLEPDEKVIDFNLELVKSTKPAMN